MRKIFLFTVMLAAFGAQAQPNEYEQELAVHTAPFSAIGSWRGVFQLRPGVEVPFNFEIRPSGEGAPVLFFRNGEEWFEGGHIRLTGDSLFIPLDQFDNELAFAVGEGVLAGSLRKQDRSGAALAVRIEPNNTVRFPETGAAAAANISGTYSVTFAGRDGKDEQVVGIFKQNGKKLSGTFLRITGDSRYLEGLVEGNTFYLSSFYGSGVSYYKGTIGADGRLTGENIGARRSQAFTAVADAHAALPDAYKLTYLKPGYSSFDFSFPDVDGRVVSLKDKKFSNKVVIVTIGGTWCPNCVDETAFLAPWYAANRARGIEVVSIQYERQLDTAFLRKVIGRQRQRYGITYDQVIGGIADKQVVANSLPSLNTFLAFPTTIFIDKQGRVARIHTGYTGPATGAYYAEFKKEFDQEVSDLLKQ